MRPQDAFDENRPLPASALSALNYLNEKDAVLDRYRAALEEIGRHVDGYMAACAKDGLEDCVVCRMEWAPIAETVKRALGEEQA